MKKLRVLLADDHRLFRDGLRTLLEKQVDIEVIGEATDGPGTISAVQSLKPDIVLLDVSMPGLNGIETVRKLKAEHRSLRIIMLSMHSDQRFVVESLRAGASGYVVKDCAIDELLAAIHLVAKDQLYLSQALAASVVKDYISMTSDRAGSVFSVLSAREREVLQLLAEGKSTKEIATAINVSVKTVETHRKQIMDKLDIHSVAELTKYAIREGLTPLG
jgi:DNA-binding NarL/FixJ family response regulator